MVCDLAPLHPNTLTCKASQRPASRRLQLEHSECESVRQDLSKRHPGLALAHAIAKRTTTSQLRTQKEYSRIQHRSLQSNNLRVLEREMGGQRVLRGPRDFRPHDRITSVGGRKESLMQRLQRSSYFDPRSRIPTVLPVQCARLGRAKKKKR